MDVKGFDDPKSVDVLARLVHSLTCDGDLVVDFFAGSGSTGHAVWDRTYAMSRVVDGFWYKHQKALTSQQNPARTRQEKATRLFSTSPPSGCVAPRQCSELSPWGFGCSL
ncbi:DNA methyltransferase [Mycobacteroides abscessus]|uniref:DNA methyltransferase n=1 Tax=Mycobacteroides abscessus TaxID=36809 RepID=UPI000940C479